MSRKIIIDHLERVASIIIIRIDHGEGAVHHVNGAQHGMGGSPRLCPSVRNTVAFRNIVDILICVGNFHIFLKTVSDGLPEIRFIFLFNNEHNLLKSGALCVEN